LEKPRVIITIILNLNIYRFISFQLNEVDRLLNEITINRENLEQCLDLSQKIHFQLNEFNKQYLFYEQWFENIQRTSQTLSEQTLTIDEKLRRYHDIQIELDKRKQILNTLTHDYPQIVQQISPPIQQLIGNIERMKTSITRKQEVNSSINLFVFVKMNFFVCKGI